MRKLLFVMLCAMFSIEICAQEKIKETVDSRGLKSCFGTEFVARDTKDRVVFRYNMCGFQNADEGYDIFLCIRATSLASYTVKENSSLLIKNKDGEIVELNTPTGGDASIPDIHTGVTVYSDYSTPVMYPVTNDDMVKISKGILKIKQETFTGAHEKEYKKDKAGERLFEQYKLIVDALGKKSSFSDGF